jgi:hypothetical protein
MNELSYEYAGFEVLVAEAMKSTDFWDVLCGRVEVQ